VPAKADATGLERLPGIEVFATASHRRLVPRSQDPLGFVPAVNTLSAFFSPALTATTESARYFTVLCAGSLLRGPTQSPKDAVLRFERIWAFGSVMAGQSQGVFGTRSAQDQVQRTGLKHRVPVAYPFFRDGSQARQGVWGLYAASAERLGLHHAGICTPRGEEVAAPILEIDTGEQLGLAGATRKAKSFRRDSAWRLGKEFGIAMALDRREAMALAAGLQAEDQQHRLARILRSWRRARERDLVERLATYEVGTARDLRLVAKAALALEELYEPTSRVVDALWQGAEHSKSWSAVVGHKAVADSAELVPKAAAALRQRLADVALLGPHVSEEFDHFLATLQGLPAQAAAVTEELLRRHADVQQAKGSDAWVDRRGERLDLGAPRAALAYDPLDPGTAVDGHLFRVGALHNIARAIHQAAVPL
jgi:hypothetical protein